MDKKPIWLEMSSQTTVEKNCNKSLTIKTFGNEKQGYLYYWLLMKMEKY